MNQPVRVSIAGLASARTGTHDPSGEEGPSAALLAGVLTRLGIPVELRPERDADSIGPTALVDLLPPLETPSKALGVWCHPTACLWQHREQEATFADHVEAAQRAGVSQIFLLGAPDHPRAGGEPWQEWLRPLLPFAAVLCAQADHLLQTLDPDSASTLAETGALEQLPRWLNGGILHDLSNYLMSCGAGVVLIGLREHGVYLRTNPNSERVSFIRKFAPGDHIAAHLAMWTERDMLIPPFEIAGAGDRSSVDALAAGFIASILHGLTPGEAIRMGAAVSASAAETEHPYESMPLWEAVEARVEGGWPQGHCGLDLGGWSASQSESDHESSQSESDDDA